jgi:hypothetical protein
MAKVWLARQQILHVNDRPIEEILVPEWGGTVCLRMMTARERSDFVLFVMGKMGADGKGTDPSALEAIKIRMIVMTAVDDQGVLIFTEEDEAALGAKSSDAINRVSEAAQRINGLGEKGVAVAEKNLEPSPSESSLLN